MLDYEDFRTGFNFKDIRDMLKAEADKKYRNGEYMFITRHTVLGRWREIKLEMYKAYLECNDINIFLKGVDNI